MPEKKQGRGAILNGPIVASSILVAATAAFFIYFLYLSSAKTSDVELSEATVRGVAVMVVYKGHPQFKIESNKGKSVRINCYLFDGDNRCLNETYLSGGVGRTLDVRYLVPSRLPLANNVALEIISGENVTLSCLNTVKRLDISASYCGS